MAKEKKASMHLKQTIYKAFRQIHNIFKIEMKQFLCTIKTDMLHWVKMDCLLLE